MRFLEYLFLARFAFFLLKQTAVSGTGSPVCQRAGTFNPLGEPRPTVVPGI